jgi:hypothetical protein
MVASWLAVMDDHPSLTVYWPDAEKFPCFWLMPKPMDETALKLLDKHSQFFPGGGSALWIDYWRKVNDGIEQQMLGRESQLLAIRYEDLISQPNTIMERITSFCDLSKHEFSVNHLEPDTAQKHTRRMTEELRQEIALQSKPERQLFGYIRDESAAIKKSLYLP